MFGSVTDRRDAYTALYRRCAANIKLDNGEWIDPVLETSSNKQNYNSDKLLVFVDEKISYALDHKTPCMMTLLHFHVGVRATLKMFLDWRCIFVIYLTQI